MNHTPSSFINIIIISSSRADSAHFSIRSAFSEEMSGGRSRSKGKRWMKRRLRPVRSSCIKLRILEQSSYLSLIYPNHLPILYHVMSSKSIIVILGLLALAAATFKPSGESDIIETDPELRELAFRTAVDEAILSLPKSRARRAIQRNCGSKLIVFVIATCGDVCTPQEGYDVATKCCRASCDEDYIRTACCPLK